MSLSELFHNIAVNYSALLLFIPLPVGLGLLCFLIRDPLINRLKKEGISKLNEMLIHFIDCIAMYSLLWFGFGITSAKNPEFFYAATQEASIKYIFILASVITVLIIHSKDEADKQTGSCSKS
ncbi:hypothetical protein [Brucella thiophenivorans]|uniref:hypothetical protein n=1 Tax=Brucella thiophenivorans TaxID=571255 RepID=UPI000B982B6B|nr:hypothetical protein [Brucella thiophenivorans]